MRKPTLFLLMVAALALAATREPARATRERSSVLLAGASEKGKERAREIRESMDKVIIPKVALAEVPIGEALKWVSSQVTEHTPESLPGRRGMTIAVQLRSEAPDRVTVDLRSATLPQVLDAICAPHRYVWCVEPYAIRVVPEESGTIRKADAERAPKAK